MQIGVIFCSCAGQINEYISFNEIKNLIFPEVAFIEEVELACSRKNQEELKSIIGEKNIDGLIILGCSFHNKGNYFYEFSKEIGINPYMLNLVNIREHVAWVTKDKKKATLKSFALLMGAIERLKRQKPLMELEIPVSDNILVVGGGIAGISAALTLSKNGKKVYLIEKESSVGGKVIKYEKLFPDLSCAPCFFHPLVEELLNSSISLRLNSTLKELKGYLGNLFGIISTKPIFVDPYKCIGCSACESVCPRQAIKVDPQSFPTIARVNREECLYFDGKCDLCIKECPVEGAINFEEKEKDEKINVGAILWATGFKEFDCRKISQLQYSVYKDIYTAMEFEELINTEGPLKGEILTEKGKIPNKIAIIHCVGSLDKNFHPYCSRICCQYAFKFNRILRSMFPEMKILHFVKEIVLPGKKAWELYSKSLSDPLVKIIRYENMDDLSIEKEETFIINHRKDRYFSDMIVLCPAIESGECPYESNSGIFLIGSVKEAMTVSDSITDGKAISADVLSHLQGEKIIKSPLVAKIDYNKCSSCGICINQCPYKAIELDSHKPNFLVSLCEGCGICVASCPSKALELEGFTSDQIHAEIEGILNSLRRREDGCGIV